MFKFLFFFSDSLTWNFIHGRFTTYQIDACENLESSCESINLYLFVNTALDLVIFWPPGMHIIVISSPWRSQSREGRFDWEPRTLRGRRHGGDVVTHAQIRCHMHGHELVRQILPRRMAESSPAFLAHMGFWHVDNLPRRTRPSRLPLHCPSGVGDLKLEGYCRSKLLFHN